MRSSYGIFAEHDKIIIYAPFRHITIRSLRPKRVAIRYAIPCYAACRIKKPKAISFLAIRPRRASGRNIIKVIVNYYFSSLADNLFIIDSYNIQYTLYMHMIINAQAR